MATEACHEASQESYREAEAVEVVVEEGEDLRTELPLSNHHPPGSCYIHVLRTKRKGISNDIRKRRNCCGCEIARENAEIVVGARSRGR